MNTPRELPLVTEGGIRKAKKRRQEVAQNRRDPANCKRCGNPLGAHNLEDGVCCRCQKNPEPPAKQRYCLRGHDTWQCGRDEGSRCKACKKYLNTRARQARQNAQLNSRGYEYRQYIYLHGLEAAKEAAGMTYAEIAEKSGVGAGTPRKYAALASRAEVKKARKIAEVLGVTVEVLEGYQGEEPESKEGP